MMRRHIRSAGTAANFGQGGTHVKARGDSWGKRLQNSLPPGWSVGNLGCCLADVQSMQGLLKDAFLFDQVTVLTDAAATRDAIIAAIRDMLAASSSGDVACFVYSGHGGRFPADLASPGRYGAWRRASRIRASSRVECLRPLTGNVVMIAQSELSAVPRCAASHAVR